MADENGKQAGQGPAQEQALVPAILAIALAVAAQLALGDGLTLLGVAGYIFAAWLFISSVRGVLDRAPVQPAETTKRASPITGAADEPDDSEAGLSRLAYLRRNWRLVTIVELFRGDIPPARLRSQKSALPPGPSSASEPAVRPARPASRTETDDAGSRATMTRVTPQGDVLVMDASRGEIVRFDEAGNLLATFSLAGLAELEILDLALSPDGQKLHIVEASSKRLRVITLTSDNSTGEEE
jgi:hypothetical protein